MKRLEETVKGILNRREARPPLLPSPPPPISGNAPEGHEERAETGPRDFVRDELLERHLVPVRHGCGKCVCTDWRERARR